MPRNQTQKKHIKTPKILTINIFSILKNNWTEMKEKNIIIAYSAIKIKANPPPPYSMLNPDTSSDSPSEKSKGVRLVSATQLISHIENKGNSIKKEIKK